MVEEPFGKITDLSMLAWICSRTTQELLLLLFTWPSKPDAICFIDNGSHNLAYMQFAQWRPWWQTSKKQASLSFTLSFKVTSPKHSFLMWNSLMICNPSNELDWIPLRGRGRREKNQTSISAKSSELNSVKAEGFSALWASANQLLISSFHIVTPSWPQPINFWLITRFGQDKKVW